jgi:hypothetical protein
LLPERLRLGTRDLLCGWSGQAAERVEPRPALQLVHEAALCTAGLRAKRALPQQGFALANGLPFLAADVSIHQLSAGHTVAQAQDLQRALGRLRRASGHYAGRVLVVDPHRLRSYSKRRMRRRRKEPGAPATKVAQTFFALDGDTGQPLGFLTGTAARAVTQATPELLDLADAVLGPRPAPTLISAGRRRALYGRIDRPGPAPHRLRLVGAVGSSAERSWNACAGCRPKRSRATGRATLRRRSLTT